MDVFTTVVGIVIAGLALFIGYRVGLKDGFRGGFHSGRTLERQLAVEERRYLTSRVVREEPALQMAPEQKFLAHANPEPPEAMEDSSVQTTRARVGSRRRRARSVRRV